MFKAMGQLEFLISVLTPFIFHRIFHPIKKTYLLWGCLLLLSTNVLSDDATKNHRAEKRQDDSFLLFGGWRPVRPGSRYHHGSATGRYHDLLSALPDSLDTSSSYYTHALPKNYHKDIYSYYPRPAIKSAPKKNTPVYMERYKPQRKPQSHGGRGASNVGPEIIDIQKIDLNQLRGLQDVILKAKELPLSQLNLPIPGGKDFEIVEVSLQQNGHNTVPRNMGYNMNRGRQRNNKARYNQMPPRHMPVQTPQFFEYISVPKIKSIYPQILPKDIAVAPIQLPHQGIEDILGVKNIQDVEVPVPAAVPYGISTGKGTRASQYGKSGSRSNRNQYRVVSQKAQQQISYPSTAYYTHQAEQPRKNYASSQTTKSNYIPEPQAEIEAELFKLSEEEVNNLLKNLQVVDKNSHEILKYLPIDVQKAKGEDLHLIVAVPQNDGQGAAGSYNDQGAAGNYVAEGVAGNYGGQDTGKYAVQGSSGSYGDRGAVGSYAIQSHQSNSQNGGYTQKGQYAVGSQHDSYQSQNTATISQNSGGYQIQDQGGIQTIEHNAAGYQMEDQNPRAGVYEQVSYQSLDEKSGYGQQEGYQDGGQKNSYQTAKTSSGYSQPKYNTSPNGQGTQEQKEPSYIQVISPPDENGYRREPVLAVELKEGQTIEDAIKALDPETLRKLGAHGKDGLEIEVVEVPVEEYSESKKTETFIPSNNSTDIAKVKTTEKKS